MKLSQKQTLIADKSLLQSKIDDILKTIGEQQIYQIITDGLEEDIEYIDERIEEENNFANENKTGAYKSAGTEAKRMVKRLKAIKKKKLEVLKSFKSFLSMKQKVDKL